MRKILQSLFIHITRRRPLFLTKSPQRFSRGQVVGYEKGPFYNITHIVEIERGVWQVWGRELRPGEISADASPLIIDGS